MGCRKETLIDGQGRTLLERQLERLSPHFPDLMLLGADAETVAPLNLRALPDQEPFVGRGPLAGLLTGLRSAQQPWLALLPIDCPNLPPEAFFQALESAIDSSEILGFQDNGGANHWLPGLYHRRLLPEVQQRLETNRLSLKSLIEKAATHYVSAASAWDPQAFENLNTPEEASALGFFVPPGPSDLGRAP